jgi:hypothetical protein
MPLLFRTDGIQIIITLLNILGKQNVVQLNALRISAIALSAENTTAENFKMSKLYTEGSPFSNAGLLRTPAYPN